MLALLPLTPFWPPGMDGVPERDREELVLE